MASWSRCGWMVAIALLACGDVRAQGVAASSHPPNIVIILSDDSGYSDLGCYGGEIETPNLDALGRGGIRFRHFYNNGRCSPTRASLMTGRASAQVGFGAGTLAGWGRELPEPAYRARLSAQVPTLPELLRDAGYRTLMAGKWHLGGSLMKTNSAGQEGWKRTHPGWELTPDEIEADFNAWPTQRGFDEFFGIIEGEEHQFLIPPSASPKGGGPETLTGHSYYENEQRAKLEPQRVYSMRCYAENPRRNHPGDGTTGPAWYAADGTTDKAIGMIRRAVDEQKTFFLYLSYQSPHLPLEAPAELVAKYAGRYQDLAETGAARVRGLVREGLLPADAPVERAFARRTKGRSDKDEELRIRAAIHAAMMDSLDQNVGRVVQCLKDAGQFENTLIVYLSDNGAAAHAGALMNQPYRGCKALLWEGGPKTAFIAHWPGHIKPGSLSDTVGWVGDLLPTCLSVAGATYPAQFRGASIAAPDGLDLLPALIGDGMPPREYLFFNDKGQQSVIFQGRWKLLINPGWYRATSARPQAVRELYDLATDPVETRDLAGEKPDLVRQLAEACDAWQRANGIVEYGQLLETHPKLKKD